MTFFAIKKSRYRNMQQYSDNKAHYLRSVMCYKIEMQPYKRTNNTHDCKNGKMKKRNKLGTACFQKTTHYNHRNRNIMQSTMGLFSNTKTNKPLTKDAKNKTEYPTIYIWYFLSFFRLIYNR